MAKKKAHKKKSNRPDKRSTALKTPVKTNKVVSAAPQPEAPPLRSVKLPSAVTIFKKSLKTLYQNWLTFGGITLIYSLLTIIFVRQFSGGLNISKLKTDTGELFGSSANGWAVGVDIFQFMLGKNRNVSEVSGLYQVFFFIIVSLAIIWALRQVHAGTAVKVKESFYRGMYPLVQFIFMLIVFSVQLLPLFISASVYRVILENGLAVTTPEQILWAVVFLLLSLLSVYLISSSIFALYIVTLPDMTPMGAIRSARKLVRRRRWLVVRKIAFLPIALFLLLVLIMIPLIIFLAPIAEWAYFVLSMASIPIIHSYYYSLYRELL